MYKGRKQLKFSGRGGYFLASVGASLGLILAASLIMSAIAYASDDPTGKISVFSLIALIASAVAGGFASAVLSPEYSLGRTAITSLITVLILILAGAIVDGGALGLSALMNYLCYFGISVLTSLFARHRKKRRRRR